MSILLLLCLFLGHYAPCASSSSSFSKEESSYKLPKRPRQRARDLPPANPFPPVEPYLFSINDDRIDLYLPTYYAGEEVLRTADGAVEHIIIRGSRLPGTRAALHTHDEGGVTCVSKGQITIFSNDTAKVRQERRTQGARVVVIARLEAPPDEDENHPVFNLITPPPPPPLPPPHCRSPP